MGTLAGPLLTYAPLVIVRSVDVWRGGWTQVWSLVGKVVVSKPVLHHLSLASRKNVLLKDVKLSDCN